MVAASPSHWGLLFEETKVTKLNSRKAVVSFVLCLPVAEHTGALAQQGWLLL